MTDIHESSARYDLVKDSAQDETDEQFKSLITQIDNNEEQLLDHYYAKVELNYRHKEMLTEKLEEAS